MLKEGDDMIWHARYTDGLDVGAGEAEGAACFARGGKRLLDGERAHQKTILSSPFTAGGSGAGCGHLSNSAGRSGTPLLSAPTPASVTPLPGDSCAVGVANLRI